MLDEEHRQLIEETIRNILSTETAKNIYAQIVDGLPLASTVDEAHADLIIDANHPVLQHKELCSEALEKSVLLRDTLDTSTLRFNATLSLSLSPWKNYFLIEFH